MFTGLLLIGLGGYVLWQMRMYYILGGGLILVGGGSILCGLTNGFTDHSPRGRKLNKIGMFLFVAGLLPSIYGLWKFI